jgi:endoglucanase
MAKARVLPESVVIVSLETSSERGGACRMGDGVIVRVGDRTSIFDSAATSALSHLARESQIPFQRCLMSGGTCEATAYQLYGYRTAALCVALGNYHNCGPEEKIDSEFVALADAEAMARLCAVAASAGDLPDPVEALRDRLEREFEQYRAYF